VHHDLLYDLLSVVQARADPHHARNATVSRQALSARVQALYVGWRPVGVEVVLQVQVSGLLAGLDPVRSQPEYQPERWNPQAVPGCGSVNDNYPAFPLLAQDSISLLAAARVTLYGRINTVKCWRTHKSGIRLSRSVVGLIRDYENRDCDSAIARLIVAPAPPGFEAQSFSIPG
jgi:hypothetical protein